MRIVCSSDLHGTLPEDLPEGDILVIAGDVSPVWDHDRQFQANWLKGEFRRWLTDQPHNEIVFVGGNHDFVLQSTPKEVVSGWFADLGVHYLEDGAVELDGVKFYGTPWTPTFGNWAFMKEETMLSFVWENIPSDTNILISHGPPRGHCDFTAHYGNENVGSWTLRNRIEHLADCTHVICGHIHEAYGESSVGPTKILNVSYMDLDYNPVNAPVVIEL